MSPTSAILKEGMLDKSPLKFLLSSINDFIITYLTFFDRDSFPFLRDRNSGDTFLRQKQFHFSLLFLLGESLQDPPGMNPVHLSVLLSPNQ